MSKIKRFAISVIDTSGFEMTPMAFVLYTNSAPLYSNEGASTGTQLDDNRYVR